MHGLPRVGSATAPPFAKVADLWSFLSRTSAGSVKAYFKGNGTNVLKIAPETSIKLGLNDYLKRVVPQVRQAAGSWKQVLVACCVVAAAWGCVASVHLRLHAIPVSCASVVGIAGARLIVGRIQPWMHTG